MLQTLRDKTSGWIATVILGLLIVPFAFVGVQDYFTRAADDSVATVSAPPSWWAGAPGWLPVGWIHEEITQQEYRDQIEQERARRRTQEGERFDARAFDSVDNKRRILDAMIDERARRLWAERQGLAVGNDMVRRTISEIPAFQSNGRFSMQQYRLALRTMRPPQTEAGFEQLVRDGLTQSLVPDALSDSAFVTAGELKRIISLLGERRDALVIELPAPPVDTAPVTPAEMQSWYRANMATYRAPEQVKLEYVELDAATLPTPAFDDTVLRQRYEKERSRFVQQEQRAASHILVRVDAAGGAAADTAARQKAASLAAQARQPGADFAALARANSDDTGSRQAGGDLGLIGRGVMAAPFEKALFAMQPGQVSDPVKTEFGWHVIQLRQVQTGKQEPFEQVRESLAAEHVEAERERAYNALTNRLVDAVLKNPTALAAAAREAGLAVKVAGPVTRGQGEGVLGHPAVQRAAFSDTVVQERMATDPIEVGPNRAVVLRVVSHTPERQLRLEEVSGRVAAAVRADRMRRSVQKRADAILAKVRAGQPLVQVATQEGLPAPRGVQGVPRGTDAMGPGTADALFSVSSQPGKPAAGSHLLPDGRMVVFVVERVSPGTQADIPPAEAAGLQRQLAQLNGRIDADSFSTAIRRGLKVEVNNEAL